MLWICLYILDGRFCNGNNYCHFIYEKTLDVTRAVVGHDRMVVGSKTTYTLSAFHH